MDHKPSQYEFLLTRIIERTENIKNIYMQMGYPLKFIVNAYYHRVLNLTLPQETSFQVYQDLLKQNITSLYKKEGANISPNNVLRLLSERLESQYQQLKYMFDSDESSSMDADMGEESLQQSSESNRTAVRQPMYSNLPNSILEKSFIMQNVDEMNSLKVEDPSSFSQNDESNSEAVQNSQVQQSIEEKSQILNSIDVPYTNIKIQMCETISQSSLGISVSDFV